MPEIDRAFQRAAQTISSGRDEMPRGDNSDYMGTHPLILRRRINLSGYSWLRPVRQAFRL
jgi:hypothetical protein